MKNGLILGFWIKKFNPYPANVDKMVGLLPVLANGGWDLIQRLKG